MSTELEKAHGSPWTFTKTSNDVFGISDTADFGDIIDTMEFKLPKKCLLTISYYLEIEIASVAENNNWFQAVYILCTLDPTNTNFEDGVDCHPSGEPLSGTTRGVPFGNNFGFNTQRGHGAHSFTWVEKVKAGSHKIFMRASYGQALNGPPPSPQQDEIITVPKILKRTLVVQAVPNSGRGL